MAFEQSFLRTEVIAGASAVQSLSNQVSAPPGAYDSGLLSVVDEAAGRSLLEPWHWLLGTDPVALAATWSGNIVFWSPRKGAVFLIDTQRGRSTLVDQNVDHVFNDVLTREAAKEELLLSGRFEAVRARIEDLVYGECYMPVPYPMLGGSGAIETYDKGALDVYLSITGQTIRQLWASRK
jgi:hypothetical protein